MLKNQALGAYGDILSAHARDEWNILFRRHLFERVRSASGFYIGDLLCEKDLVKRDELL